MIHSNIKKYNRLFSLVAVYFSWISMHYVCTHVYAEYCTPKTIKGLIISPFVVVAPHCTGLRWCITQGANTITTMWGVLGTWVAAKMIIS